MGNHPYTMYARRNKFKPDSVVVITGASSGMGKEITYRYAERGCKIVIGSRNL
jgi:NADP-dependent 3-hydroxy acid dehydrogenase YdfG